MKAIRTALFLLWSAAITAGFFYSVALTVWQHHRLHLYERPYLQVKDLTLPEQAELSFVFPVPYVTEAQSLKIFTVPELSEKSWETIRFVLESPSGERRPVLFFPAQCQWQGRNYSCIYLNHIVPGEYRLGIKTGSGSGETVIGSLLIAPSTEFGYLLLMFSRGVTIVLFLLFVPTAILFFRRFRKNRR